MRIGGGKDKFDVLGRFFQRFEHGVERGFGQHVHFVDDVNLVFACRGRVLGVFQHFADVVDAGVAGGVDFQQVHKSPCINGLASGALPAWFAVMRVFAVEAFGENAGDGGFAYAARACEQIGVVQTSVGKGVLQGFDNVLLPHEVGEGFGAPFAGENLVGHGWKVC